MNCPLLDLDIPIGPTEVDHELVVISRDVNDARAFARFAQNFLNNVVVLLWPINSTTQRPDIDEIAHDVQCLEIVLAQKVEQCRRVTAACAQVRIRDPSGSVSRWGV